MTDITNSRPRYCLAFHVDSLGLSLDGYPSPANDENPDRLEFVLRQIFVILRKTSYEVDESHKRSFFDSADQALAAAVEIQSELEELNSASQFPILYFACIGIDRLPAAGEDDPSNVFEVVQLLSQSASSGEIYLSEWAYERLSKHSPQCRFSKQLRPNDGNAIVNVFEVVWNATELEINQKRLNKQENSEEMVRAFGLRFFSILFILFGVVFLLCIGMEGARELFFRIFGEYFVS